MGIIQQSKVNDLQPADNMQPAESVDAPVSEQHEESPADEAVPVVADEGKEPESEVEQPSDEAPVEKKPKRAGRPRKK